MAQQSVSGDPFSHSEVALGVLIAGLALVGGLTAASLYAGTGSGESTFRRFLAAHSFDLLTTAGWLGAGGWLLRRSYWFYSGAITVAVTLVAAVSVAAEGADDRAIGVVSAIAIGSIGIPLLVAPLGGAAAAAIYLFLRRRVGAVTLAMGLILAAEVYGSLVAGRLGVVVGGLGAIAVCIGLAAIPDRPLGKQPEGHNTRAARLLEQYLGSNKQRMRGFEAWRISIGEPPL